MIFRELKIKGAYIIEPERLIDNRGFFTRSFSKDDFRKYGLSIEIVECNISYNKKKGTLRGLHYQDPPFEEVKIVSCTKGSIYDVVVDLRCDSPTYQQWHAEELSADSYCMLYIPKGCAHGFQTLEDDCVVYYQMEMCYHPECARGIRWNDPLLKISWPNPVSSISEKDQGYRNFIV